MKFPLLWSLCFIKQRCWFAKIPLDPPEVNATLRLSAPLQLLLYVILWHYFLYYAKNLLNQWKQKNSCVELNHCVFFSRKYYYIFIFIIHGHAPCRIYLKGHATHFKHAENLGILVLFLVKISSMCVFNFLLVEK